jgi:hypothetical protein
MPGEKNIVVRVTPALFPSIGKRVRRWPQQLGLGLMLALTITCVSGAETTNEKVEIRCVASDRMIQLVGAWAEAYRKVKPNVYINMGGSGPGNPGFGSLAHADILCTHRVPTPEERAKFSTWGLR